MAGDIEAIKHLIPPEFQGLSPLELEEKWAVPNSFQYLDSYVAEITSQRKRVFDVLLPQELDEQRKRFDHFRKVLQSKYPEVDEIRLKGMQYELLMAFLDSGKGFVDMAHILKPDEQIILKKFGRDIFEALQTTTDVSEIFAKAVPEELDRLIGWNALYRLILRVLALKKSSEQSTREFLHIQEYPEYQLSESQRDKEALLEIKRIYGEEALKDPYKVESNRRHFGRVKEWDSSRVLAQLGHSTYSDLRIAKYKSSPVDYEQALRHMEYDKSLRGWEEGTWFYRGIFESEEYKKTVMRGSLNISISVEAIREIDELIKGNLFVGNYKIGNRDQHESNYRHDSVTLYFLKPPTPALLEALSAIATKYHRGHHLLGRKIVEGFSLGEIDNIDKEHVPSLLLQLKDINPYLETGMRDFLKNPTDQQDRPLAVSEGQFYALKSALNVYGVEVDYTLEKGFRVHPIGVRLVTTKSE